MFEMSSGRAEVRVLDLRHIRCRLLPERSLSKVSRLLSNILKNRTYIGLAILTKTTVKSILLSQKRSICSQELVSSFKINGSNKHRSSSCTRRTIDIENNEYVECGEIESFTERGKEREGEREGNKGMDRGRERYTQIERERERERDIYMGRERGRGCERKRERGRKRERHIWGGRERERGTLRQERDIERGKERQRKRERKRGRERDIVWGEMRIERERERERKRERDGGNESGVILKCLLTVMTRTSTSLMLM